MQVKELQIRKQESYQPDAGRFRGTVTLSDERSTTEIQLSSRSISRIFQVIREDAASEALRCASATPRALEDAEIAPLLLEQGSL